MTSNIWLADADSLKLSDKFDYLLFTNSYVKDFLDPRRLGVCASKGMGKTFLLKCKRIKCQKSMTCLPKDSLVDNLSGLEIPNHLRSTLKKNYSLWVKAWEMSIYISIMVAMKWNLPKTANNNSNILMEKMIKTLTKECINVSPSNALRYIFTRIADVRGFINLLENTNLYVESLRNIESGLAVFIDKIDQGFYEELKKDKIFWHYAQASLAEAAYIISTISNHIKVNYAIRIEAFDGIEDRSDTFLQAKSFITTLSYSKSDCENLFNIYISNIQKTDLPFDSNFDSLIAKFTGFDKLNHSYIKNANPENTFDYIYRHTLGNPRDLMMFGNAIFLEREELKIHSKDCDYFKNIIRKQSESLITFYFGQLTHLTELTTEEFNQYVKCFNTNVFNREYLYILNRLYNTKNSEKIKSGEHSPGEEVFLKLLNLGLIGRSNKKNISDHYISFNLIQTGTSNISRVPENTCFFFHPSLSDFARKLKNDLNQQFDFFDSFIVDYDTPLNDDYQKFITSFSKKMSRLLPKIKVFISSTCYDLGTNRKNIAKLLENRGFDCLLSDRNDPDFIKKEHIHSHDACFETVGKADYLLFILDGRYGSPYSGKKYNSYVDEIKKLVPEFEEVSISCMELFASSLYNIKRFSYIKSDIFDALHDYKKGKLVRNSSYNAKPIDKFDGIFVPNLLKALKFDNWASSFVVLNEKRIVDHFLKCIDEFPLKNHII